MRVWADRLSRDLQRLALARRMFAHEARSQTIAAWTGLPKQRIQRLNRTHGLMLTEEGRGRHRGPSPQGVNFYFRSWRLRNEAAALAGLCQHYGLLPRNRLSNAARQWPEVARGERLCDAFEMYRLLLPESTVSLEYFVVLVLALSEGDDISLGRCVGCGAAILADRYAERRLMCVHCATMPANDPRRLTSSPPTTTGHADTAIPHTSLL